MSAKIDLPMHLSHGHIPLGLTAPALRMALVLIAGAGDRTGNISIVKPHLERDAGVRLDNAHRSLERLREATIADGTGAPVLLFSELTYLPGEQKRLAGIITGSVSNGARELFGTGEHAGKTIGIDLDELRGLSTVPGVLLLLRLTRERNAEAFNIRLGEDECALIFGDYLGRAAIARTNAAGDAFKWTSLSRIYSELIAPGVKDLWSAIEGHVVDAAPVGAGGRGTAWSYIELSMTPVRKRLSLKELAERAKTAEEYDVLKKAPRSIKV